MHLRSGVPCSRIVKWLSSGALTSAALVLLPGTAGATCAIEPFDRVVHRSDTVLVGTVIEARPAGPHRVGIIVRIDVEDVLKGSAADGERVRMSSCGPFMTDGMVRSWAKHEIGQRGLFLLSYGTAYSEVTSPQGMTLDQRIARARDLLGLADTRSALDGAAHVTADGRTSLWPWAVVGALVSALAAVVAFVRRVRGRH